MYSENRLVVAMVKSIKNCLRYIATVFLVLLVSLCIYTFVVTDILKKDYVNVFGYTYFVVATGSMSGTIEVDDIIFVKLTKDVQVNDVITFKNKDGDIITHRLIQKNEDSYITKGDVNNVADESIQKNQIIGKVNFSISPSFILKSIAIFLIIFILLALINFDNIIKKYIVKENSKTTMDEDSVSKIPEQIFKDPKAKKEEPSSGLTVTISFDEMEELDKKHEKEVEREEDVEVLDDFEEGFSFEPIQKKKMDDRKKETIDFVVSILKCKKNNVAKARMNKKWLEKYQYVYRLSHLFLNSCVPEICDDIKQPPFSEIYDYDLEKVGLTESVRNRIYDMPFSGFLRILTYCILYNDEEMFDGVYKILKYKVSVDCNHEFVTLNKNDTRLVKQIKSLISFMQKVSNKFDNKHVFELDKIERMVKIGKY